jgi:hypothetical protein
MGGDALQPLPDREEQRFVRFMLPSGKQTHAPISEWWGLPSKPIGDDDVMYVDRETGIVVWNSDGYVSFDSGVVKGLS